MHTAAVRTVLDDLGTPAVILDAQSLEQHADTWTPEPLWQSNANGWIRRLAPPRWRPGVAAQSHDSAVRGAWMSQLTGLVLAAECSWLTGLPQLLQAESKMFQLRRARSLGIQIPDTVVTSRRDEISVLGPTVVVKPLGPASFVGKQGDEQVVPAQTVQVADLDPIDVKAAPFMFQEVIEARAHLRVVTVENAVWVARLEAINLPLDWRTDDLAHRSFQIVSSGHDEVRTLALRLARSCGVGFSSQDWVEATDGRVVFLDLNPSGQWLFLQDGIAESVTYAIGSYLAGVPFVSSSIDPRERR